MKEAFLGLIKIEDRKVARARRHKRVRKKVFGTAERPRLSVYESLSHIYAQIIDDEKGWTLVAASSLSHELRQRSLSGGNIAGAEAVGELIAKKALEKNIRKIVLDRGGFHYHGRIKALAEAARKHGLEF